MTHDTRTAALELLRRLVGRDDADFHEGQFEAISALVDHRERALVVQRTGWGKSAVYFVATLLLRQRGAGPSILVSPLLALMRDQVAAAARAGVRAASISSANAHEWDDIITALDRDDVDVLLVSPERLNNPSFRENQLPELVSRTGLLVVDEAHCISDWGHDFRPDYRRLRDLVSRMPQDVPVLATTATANQRVVTDVAEQLSSGGQHVVTIRGPLARQSLRLGVLQLPSNTERLAWLLTHLGDLPGSGIVYTLTVSAAEDIARLLRDAGHNVLAYTGRTDPAERERAEAALKSNEVKALIATSALGMGFDKPDLGFVVHVGAPSSPVAYYQQVGRAGRATDHADVLLLPGEEDQAIWQYFATASMPNEQAAHAVIEALQSSDRVLSTPALESRVDLKRTTLELLLKVLDVDGAVQRVSGGWQATGHPWTYDRERYERIATERRAEQNAMLEYEAGRECRMAFLQRQLDDDTASACGRCDVCAGAWYPTGSDDSASSAAAQSLTRVGVVIEPRAMWPTGSDRVGLPVKGRIPAEQQLRPGRALARLTDLGWGGRLREIFAADAVDGPIDRATLDACVRVLADWEWEQRPAAVVSMPSDTKPQLIQSLAEGLASIGRLPYLGALQAANDAAHAGPMNSVFRLASVWSRFSVGPELVSRLDESGGAPVLLVDDRVDSRWSITVAGQRLITAGAGAVLPFALALQA
ncbi:RecQ family ATP-dependent DNA helicase [Paramicrobacterium sp. CJ85]|uniref:RecQ family ATP-dependent DNA helicase n=1 Tax=Paramicrobacterium sp. CJ85 TaxID=3445355 RepID=UPI003F5E2B08